MSNVTYEKDDCITVGEFLEWLKENNIPLDTKLGIVEAYEGCGGSVQIIDYNVEHNSLTLKDVF